MPDRRRAGSATTHRLTRWRTDWSSQTGASQLGILHGSNHDVPAFRWYEKDTGEVMVSNRPSGAAELQRRAVERTGDGGLLAVDGASRGNLFSGGAGPGRARAVGRRRGAAGRTAPAPATSPTSPTRPTPSRTAVSFVAEVVREIGQSTRARLRRRAAAGRTRRALPLHPRLRDRRRAGRGGRRGDRGHARRPHRRLRRPGRLRRGGAPLRARAAGTRGRCCAASTGRSR